MWCFIYYSARKRKAKTKEIILFVFIYMLSFKSSTLGNGLWFGCRLFSNALNRMINRRRVPEEISFDNRTNFVAANRIVCINYVKIKIKDSSKYNQERY